MGAARRAGQRSSCPDSRVRADAQLSHEILHCKACVASMCSDGFERSQATRYWKAHHAPASFRIAHLFKTKLDTAVTWRQLPCTNRGSKYGTCVEIDGSSRAYPAAS